MKLLLLLLAASVGGGSAATPLGCRDQNNNLVDWYVLYKLPILTYTEGFLRNGSAYLHYSSESADGQWLLSEIAIDNPLSPPGLTLANVYENPERASLEYIFYNDEWPNGNTSYDSGHTKGVVAFEGDQGFWMIHTVPKFPPAPGEGTEYSYASNGYSYGQSFICMTFATSELDKVYQQVNLNDPFTYASKDSTTLKHPYRKIAVGGRSMLIKQQASAIGERLMNAHKSAAHVGGGSFNIDTILTINGIEITSFAKSGDYGDDLYSGLVAPDLATDLLVECWRASLPSDCTGQYDVLNVRNVTAFADERAFDFGSTKDHSKWAVSSNEAKPWVCLGDINRAESQFKRGGGTACVNNPSLWNIFYQMVTVAEPCP